MYLLDTDVVSELRKVRSGKADPGVIAWASVVPSGQLFVSSITIHKLEHGVLLAERADPPKGAVLRRWLDDSVAAAFDPRVLVVDTRVRRRAAALHVPDPARFRDALIGASALVHKMTLVTRNTEDFARFDGPDVIDPWHRSSTTLGVAACRPAGAGLVGRPGEFGSAAAVQPGRC
jgi:predicted nucleic acid-binding protein